VEVEQLKAQAAAMREVLEELANAPAVFDDERLNYIEIQVSKASLEDAQKALSTDAGRGMLERVQAMEKVVGAARRLKPYKDIYVMLDGLFQALTDLDERGRE